MLWISMGYFIYIFVWLLIYFTLTEKELKTHISSGPLLPSIASSRYNMEVHSCIITFFPLWSLHLPDPSSSMWHMVLQHEWRTLFLPHITLGFPRGSDGNLPVMQETQVQSLGQESLEKGTATHSCILVWEIPQTEEPGRLWSMGS